MTTLLLASAAHRFRVLSAAACMLMPPVLMAASPKASADASNSTIVPDRSSAYYHYGLAHLYEQMAISAGRPDYATQAVEQYKMALNADPNSPVLQDGLADLYFKIGRVSDATVAAKERIKQNPNDLSAHTLLGQIYLRSLGDMQGAQSGQYLQLAIAEYETIARLKPDDMEPKLLLGQLYALNHESEKAEAEFKDAQKIDANSEDVVLNMARLYSEEGDAQRAADTLAAVPADDRTARMEFALGASYDQLKKYKDAAAAYQRALDIEPDNPDARSALANALFNNNQLNEALTIYTSLVESDPGNVQWNLHIADIERRQGNYEAALATLQKAKEQSPDSMQVSYSEALVYDALGRYDQAISELKKLVASTERADGKYSDDEKQNRAYFLSRLGILYGEEGKTDDAIATYKQIIELGGDYARDGYGSEIDAYRDAHEWKEALATAAAAAKALPKDHPIQMTYAQQLADMGQVDQAIALAKAQMVPGPDELDSRERFAELYIRLKRFSDANEQIQKAEALATKPDDKVQVLFLRGEYYDRQKNYEQAEEQFRKALAIDPQNAGVLNYLGYMLADQGQKLPEALKMIRKAVELDPQNYAYLDSLGWAYYKTGQYDLAEENIRKANERNSSDPTIHDHLGEVYQKTGNLKLAVEQWERSMSDYASSLPADADPHEIQKVQRKLEEARLKLAKLGSSVDKNSK